MNSTLDGRISLKLRALVLTPVHVGDGSEWTPESFMIRDGEVQRFDPGAVVSSLDAAGRKAFIGATQGNSLDVRAVQRILHGAVRERHVLDRIALSTASKREISEAIENSARAGRVHPFVRSGQKPVVPGSAIKGAIRTAILSAGAEGMPKEWAKGIEDEWRSEKRSSKLSARVQKDVFRLNDTNTDADPFRFADVWMEQ